MVHDLTFTVHDLKKSDEGARTDQTSKFCLLYKQSSNYKNSIYWTLNGYLKLRLSKVKW